MRLLYLPGAVGVIFLGLSFMFPISIVGAILPFSVFSYFAYARTGSHFEAETCRLKSKN
jgi:hypothetical protein